jgi:hypothetical protein
MFTDTTDRVNRVRHSVLCTESISFDWRRNFRSKRRPGLNPRKTREFPERSGCAVKSTKVTRYIRVLPRILSSCVALIASGRAAAGPGGIRTHGRSPTFMMYWVHYTVRRRQQHIVRIPARSAQRVTGSDTAAFALAPDPGWLPKFAFCLNRHSKCRWHPPIFHCVAPGQRTQSTLTIQQKASFSATIIANTPNAKDCGWPCQEIH